MCEDEYKSRLKYILEGANLPNIDDIIAEKVSECKGEALCSILSLEDVFERDIESVAKTGEISLSGVIDE